jgi:hypothetical protein
MMSKALFSGSKIGNIIDIVQLCPLELSVLPRFVRRISINRFIEATFVK